MSTQNGSSEALARTQGNGSRPPPGRTLPHDSTAEKHVLGACLLDSGMWPIVVDTLEAADFYEPRHGLIFGALGRIAAAGGALDTVSLRSALAAAGTLTQAGGDEYVLGLTDTIPMVANTEKHCARIRELATVRRVYAAATAIAAEALDGVENVGDFLDRAEKDIALAGERRRHSSELVHISTANERMVDQLRKQIETGATSGYKTGLRLFDKYTEGLVPKEVMLLAARPGMGKTAAALEMAAGVAESTGLPVLIFSAEMPMEQLSRRMVSSRSKVDGGKIRGARINRADWDSMSQAVRELNALNIYVDDNAQVTILDIRRAARKKMRELGKLGLIVIDYLQLLKAIQRERSRYEELGETSRLTKGIAKELGCPVLALAQAGRKAEDRGKDKRPMMQDLRESGDLEQDADTIVFIYRDEVYNSNSEDKGIAEFIIAKQRNGMTGTVKVAFQKELTRFSNLYEEREDSPQQSFHERESNDGE